MTEGEKIKHNARSRAWYARTRNKKTRKLHAAKGRKNYKTNSDQRREYIAGWPKGRIKERWELQKGLCDCCGIKMLRNGLLGVSATADHDHDTGQPRGLICSNCNRAEGYLKKYGAAVALYVAKWKGFRP